MRKTITITIIVLTLLTTVGYALLLNPGFQERLGWHVHQWAVRIRTWLHPPQQVVFSANADPQVATGQLPEASMSTPTLLMDDQEVSVEMQPTFAPIPSAYSIEGGRYYSQNNRWNYCGPANIAMLLSFWGWEGDHDAAARSLRTNSLDKNVMPYEMADYAKEEAGMGALVRVGGDLETLKRLIAAGYPVLVEKGPHFRDIHYQITWMGHYQVLSGYNEPGQYFIAQDSYIEPDYPQPYDLLIEEWRSFNYTYLVVFPPEKEEEVLSLLSKDANEYHNYQRALAKAQNELYQTTGVDQFFAMFNYGTNLVALRDYAGAAKAYDQAFLLYDTLPQDLSVRPYRILWYQTGPFFAYYYTGRYRDVIEKATRNSIEMVRDDIPALEESYYWRGVARIAIGDQEEGIDDLLQCLEYHRHFEPCIAALNEQGIFP